MFLRQVTTILRKNFLINYRKREFAREIISIIIFLTLILVIHKYQPSNTMIVFYMTLTITSYARSMALSWVTERQTKQKELQKIMGVTSGAYLTAWLTYFFLNGLYVTFLFIIPLQLFGLFQNSTNGFSSLLLLYFLYMVATFCFILFLCSFFNDAKIAAQGTMFIQLLTSLLYFLLLSDKFSQSKPLLQLTSLFPSLAYDFSVLTTGVIPIYPPINYTFSLGQMHLGIDILVYFTLFIYLDQVMPNEFGTHKHPLFFLKQFVELFEHVPQEKQQLLELTGNPIPSSSARYHQQKQSKTKATIFIENVTKKFGDLKAVDDLTLTLHQRQIFCLLGHNGAGKSTTINLLTGLLEKTEGKITINGLNYQNDLDKIRKSIGLCLQQDVLYDELTVEEHIAYYATIKGMDPALIPEEVQTTIRKCALVGEYGKLSKNLSGGNKRKLSLANALVAGSKIIFLDEPSSGLDPNSRQSIWSIMKEIKNQNRTIILTTHHLQQAEHLAQRIGIMAQGKLLILGDSDFIKQNFGVGYHLYVTFNEQSVKMKENCSKIVTARVPSAKQDGQSANNVLKFILPTKAQPQFGSLFKQLQDLDYQVSLQMCSLEDAFVNIGINEGEMDNKQDIPELPDIKAPEGIVPEYNFATQFNAVFFKKATSTFRSFSTVISIVLPVIFILAGTLVTTLAFDDNVPNSVKFYILSYFMIWSFIFNTSAYCGSIVLQREKKFKYLSNVMGLRKLPYWTANFTFDICMFLIPIGLFFIIVLSLHNKAQFIIDKIGYLVMIFIAFSLSFITYSYTFSFVFQKSATAYRFFPFLNFFIFYLLPSIAAFIIPDSIFTKNIVPLYSPFVAFAYCFTSPQIVGSGDFFIAPSIYYLLGVMLLQAVVYAFLTYILQTIRYGLKDRHTIANQDLVREGEDDEGVKNEITKVHHLKQTEPIVVDSLYKKYSNGYLAIRNNTFVVEKGEMFGLLGPNGAGKSTTFNILTAAIPKTGGRVRLNQIEINKGIMEIFQNVGICPQFDSLYDNLTVREHLTYFARVKGQSKLKVEELIDYYLQVMQLTNYENVQAGKLSGGNKRKLCVSMALIGNPQLMFFDEPSSGVDPIGKRFLWKTLNESLKQSESSIVLTTHSMNEAESLCTRIGILIKGKFVCLGTPLELKRKYGNGYRISCKVSNINEVLPQLRQLVKEQYPIFKQFLEVETQKIIFQVPTQGFKFYKAFELFQNRFMEQGLIEDFEISEASLEQIFLYFSRLQPPPVAEEMRAQPWDVCCFEWGADGCILKI